MLIHFKHYISGRLLLLFVGCIAFSVGCKTTPVIKQTLIAFGSCGHQDSPQPILSLAASYKPNAFIFLGDNIYGDTDNMDTLANKYARWMTGTDYQRLISTTKILATWDDHDFGRNDAGKEYPFKEESKQVFLKAFQIPDTSKRYLHKGIYEVTYLHEGDKRIQVVLLDVRTFRDKLTFFNPKTDTLPKGFFYTPDYTIQYNPDSTLLGEEQWRWLKETLQQPADLRLICSGSQFGITYNGYEAWANFPHEQQRMLNLIKETRANGIIFLTGDVHYAEISKWEPKDIYPIYDITSSGITSTWDFATPNGNRIEGPIMDNHFGLLTVKWLKDPEITLQIMDIRNNQRIEYTLKRSEICFK